MCVFTSENLQFNIRNLHPKFYNIHYIFTFFIYIDICTLHKKSLLIFVLCIKINMHVTWNNKSFKIIFLGIFSLSRSIWGLQCNTMW